MNTPQFISRTTLFIEMTGDGYKLHWAKTRADFRGLFWRQCREKWRAEKLARRVRRFGGRKEGATDGSYQRHNSPRHRTLHASRGSDVPVHATTDTANELGNQVSNENGWNGTV